jgi:bifunctional DNA-binding transcriptional regulator/antitoxin component of YhaV-PrlF toxin-antitoxin module
MPFVKVLRGGQITMPKELRKVLEIKEWERGTVLFFAADC